MRGVLLGIVLAGWFIACMRTPEVEPEWQKHWRLENEIMIRWEEIRKFRHEAGMDLEPASVIEIATRQMPPQKVKAVCSNGNNAPKQCHDICNLADDICDNMEHICDLAEQLGKSDSFAQEKCSSAKGSCSEAKQRCCGCAKKDVTP